MVLCVAALPLVASADVGWPAWAIGAAAVVLPVVAAVLLTRAARREDVAFGALAGERDALASELSRTTRLLEESTASLVAEQQRRADEQASVETAVVALSRKVQASAHRVQEEAARMVQRHPSDPDVLESSMRIDHAAAQHARQAQSLVALCGRRPGQTWDDALPLPDVVRAAAGRITAFGRVEVSGDPGLAVSGRAVEPLVHVVAELLANATQCSPPNTQVLVTLRQVQRGAVVEVDDCGVGMDEHELARVRAIANGQTPVGLAALGEVPQTGLAVVGTYARFLGLRVDLVESVYGGLRAVVLIPGELTETAAAPVALAASAHEGWQDGALPATGSLVAQADHGAPGPDEEGAAADAPAGTGRVTVAEPAPESGTTPVLPQRRSRRAALDRPGGSDADPVRSPARPNPLTEPMRTPSAPRVADQTAAEAGAWMGAFFAATHTDRRTDPQHSEPSATADAEPEDR